MQCDRNYIPVIRLASGLHESILTFNIMNINEENYIDHVQQMRSKYKQVNNNSI